MKINWSVWILEDTVDFDLQRQRRKESEGKVYSGALELDGLQFRLAFTSGLGTAGRGRKLVKFGCYRKDCKEVCVLMFLIYKRKHFFMHKFTGGDNWS